MDADEKAQAILEGVDPREVLEQESPMGRPDTLRDRVRPLTRILNDHPEISDAEFVEIDEYSSSGSRRQPAEAGAEVVVEFTVAGDRYVMEWVFSQAGAGESEELEIRNKDTRNTVFSEDHPSIEPEARSFYMVIERELAKAGIISERV